MKIGSMNNPKDDLFLEIIRIKRDGFDYIDLAYEPPTSNLYRAKEINEFLNEFPLEVVGHTNPTLPAIYPVESIRKEAVAELKRSIAFFQEIGAKKVTIHPFLFESNLTEEEVIEQNILVLRELAGFAGDGILLMLENFVEPFDSVETFKMIKKRVPRIMVHIDIGHCNLAAGDANELLGNFLAEFKEEIIHIHLHDNNGLEDLHLPLDCGTLLWKKSLALLLEAGYDQTITLEIFSSDKEYLLHSRDKVRDFWAREQN